MKTSSWILVVLLAVAAVGAGGCFDNTTEIRVHKNGSATITKTTYFSAAMLEMVAEMGRKMEAQGAPKPKDFIAQQLDADKIKKTAATLGEGVTVKSSQAVTHADGRRGVKIVLAVADITKLNVPLAENNAGAQGRPADVKATRFLFVKGDSPTVTVIMPKMDPPPAAKADDTAAAPDDEAAPKDISPEMMAMFKDMRMAVTLAVDGKITRTNASLADKDAGTVQLFYMDLGGIVADPKNAEKLKSLKGIKDPWKAQQKLKELGLDQFVHVETHPKVTVTFK